MWITPHLPGASAPSVARLGPIAVFIIAGVVTVLASTGPEPVLRSARTQAADAEAIANSERISELGRELERNPDRVAPRLELGTLLLNAGEPERARRHLEIAVTLDPSSAEARRLLGLAHFRAGNLGPAITQYEQAVALAPREERLHLTLTDILLLAGLDGEAETVALNAAAAFPASQEVHYKLADLLASSGRLGRSLEGFQRALELDGPVERGRLYERIGEARAALGQLPEAEAAYGSAVRIDPSNLEARLGLASVYLRDGRFEDARASYMQVADGTGDNVAALLGLSEVYSRMGRFPEARDVAESILSVAPGDRRARYLLGTALLRMGRADEGRAELDEFRRLEAEALAAEHSELEVLSFNRNAIALVRQGRLGDAIALLRQGTQIRPDAASLFLNLSLIQSETGAHRDAADTLESMSERGLGDAASIHQHLAREYEILGDVEASRKHLEIYQTLTTRTLQGTFR